MGVAVITLEEQIACIERELAFRVRGYPRWVRDGKLTQSNADVEMLRMSAVLATLNRVMTGLDHQVPGAADIRRGAEARVLCACAPYISSQALVRVERKLRGE